MILIDTNVISELWKINPHPGVLAWMDAQATETLYLSAITVAELRFGIATMPEGRRRAVYHERLENEVLQIFSGRVLPFNGDTAGNYAHLMARARANGRVISQADGYIAATAVSHGLIVATRDIGAFEAAQVKTLNPWITPA
jgi:predicted nucleic acid-binding protein